MITFYNPSSRWFQTVQIQIFVALMLFFYKISLLLSYPWSYKKHIFVLSQIVISEYFPLLLNWASKILTPGNLSIFQNVFSFLTVLGASQGPAESGEYLLFLYFFKKRDSITSKLFSPDFLSFSSSYKKLIKKINSDCSGSRTDLLSSYLFSIGNWVYLFFVIKNESFQLYFYEWACVYQHLRIIGLELGKKQFL